LIPISRRRENTCEPLLQHFNPALPGGRSWDDERETAADTVVETVNRHAPNFKRSILARKILSPLDLERDFGMIGGDIFHGALTLDQLFSARPVLGYADYRSPVRGCTCALPVRILARRDRRAGPQRGAGDPQGLRRH